jgi:hypothetical protein
MSDSKDLTTFFLSYTLIFTTFVLLALVRSINRIKILEGAFAHNEALKIGFPAPNFTARDLAGNKVDQSIFLTRQICFIFIGLDCEYCKLKYPSIRQILPNAKLSGTDIIFVCQCESNDLKDLLQISRLEVSGYVSLQNEDTLWSIYNPSNGTPYFVLIDNLSEIRFSDYVGSETWDYVINKWIE